jgi:hypothetical protein
VIKGEGDIVNFVFKGLSILKMFYFKLILATFSNKKKGGGGLTHGLPPLVLQMGKV